LAHIFPNKAHCPRNLTDDRSGWIMPGLRDARVIRMRIGPGGENRMTGTINFKRFPLLIFILFLVAFAFPRPAQAQSAEWTFMVYLDADNNLEDMGIEDFLEMSDIGSTREVNIVALFDRAPAHDDSYGDWTNTRRGLIRYGDTPTTSWGTNLGELNMGDPDSLTDFVQWSASRYPAKRYALILWNHGSGWRDPSGRLLPPTRAIASDDTSGDSLSIKEVRQALLDADNVDQFDIIGFDACLMAMVEIAYELRDLGRVMVASEDLEPGYGYPYDRIMQVLTANPTSSAAQLGTTIVEQYYNYYQETYAVYYPEEVFMQSAVDLSLMGQLAVDIAVLNQTLTDNWRLDQVACGAAAQGVLDTLDSAVIHEKHSANSSGSNGLAIYFPQDSFAFSNDYDVSVISFPADTGWGSFLHDEFFGSMGNSWVSAARTLTRSYDTPEHVDLYDFCEKLLDSLGGDADADRIPDETDNCPFVANPDQTDSDGNGVGDACQGTNDPTDPDDIEVLPFTPDAPGGTAPACGTGAGGLLFFGLIGFGLIRRF
jgi:hypothetical protein